MKHATISAVSILGTLGTVAAIGFAQPDGIEPPAGTVADTQPSLTSIDQKLDTLTAGASQFPPNLKYVQDGVFEETVELVSTSEATFVRLYGMHVLAASGNLLVGPSEDRLSVVGGSAVLQSTSQLRGGMDYSFGGLKVPTPVKFRNSGSGNSTHVTLLYWIEE